MANQYWDKQWNPVRGCNKCSPACDHCYAERMARRFWRAWGQPPPPDHFKPTLHPEILPLPLKARKAQDWFVCNTSDLFHPEVPDKFIDQVFAIMLMCGDRYGADADGECNETIVKHAQRFYILTKRPGRMAEYICDERVGDWMDAVWDLYGDGMAQDYAARELGILIGTGPARLPARIALGTTIWDQESADRNIRELLDTPAASAEGGRRGHN